jgi:PAS domain S-box-containing protein
MKISPRLSLRTRLLALISIALLPAFGLIIYKAVDEHRHAGEQVENRALRLAGNVAREHEKLAEDARVLLNLLSRLPLILLNPAACQDLFSDAANRFPTFSNLLVVNSSGTVTCKSRRDGLTVNYADRDWFKEALRTKHFVVSDYLVGRVTEQPTLVFAAPIVNSRGGVDGVLAVSADVGALNRLGETGPMPAESMFAVFDQTGTMLARYPNAEQWIGKAYPHFDQVKSALAQRRDATFVAREADGISRIYAFKPLSQRYPALHPWYVTIGIPKDIAERPVRIAFVLNLASMLAVATGALAIAWWGSRELILQPIRALMNATAKIAKGDLSTRIGPLNRDDELGSLANTFDQMAGMLQTRESERTQAEHARAQLASIVESSSDAIIGRTLDGVVTSWNHGAENLYGYTVEEAIGQPMQQIIPSELRQNVTVNLAKIKRGEHVESYQTARIRKDGTRIDVSVTVSPIVDERGSVIGVSSINRDITHGKRAEAQLRVLHEINLAITSSLDLRTVLEALLEKIDVLLPYTASHIRLLNKTTGRLDPAACRNLDEAQWKTEKVDFDLSVHRTILQSKLPRTIRNIQVEAAPSRRDFYRSEGLVSFLGVPLIAEDAAIGVLSLLTKEEHEFSTDEIRFVETLAKQASMAIYNSQLHEESKELSQELSVRAKQVRELATGLLQARDQEAKRIASILHDESGQLLAMVHISLDDLAKGLAEGDHHRVRRIQSLLDEVEDHLHDISYELHPPMLDHLGLISSLKHLADQVSKRSGIDITIDSRLQYRPAAPLEVAIYRVVQEGFNNIVKHANAHTVQVRISEDADSVKCSIQDDGIGFDPRRVFAEQARTAIGLGIPGIRERIEALGGDFQILTAPKQGTTLLVSIPRESSHG